MEFLFAQQKKSRLLLLKTIEDVILYRRKWTAEGITRKEKETAANSSQGGNEHKYRQQPQVPARQKGCKDGETQTISSAPGWANQCQSLTSEALAVW